MNDKTPALIDPTRALVWREEPFRRLVESVRDYAIFLLDEAGHVVSWNLGAERIKGYRADEILGRHFSMFYPQEAIDSGLPEHELVQAAAVGRYEDEGWRLRKDGTRFWANVVISAIHGDDGSVIGFSKVTRDLTKRRNQEQHLRESEERFRLLLEGVEDYAIFMLDPEGRLTSWNAGAQRITGYRADEVIGQSFERFFTAEDIAAGRPAEELRQALVNRRAEDLGWRLRKDGTRYWAEVVVTSLHDDHGKLRGFAKVTRDLSDKKRIESLEDRGRHLTEFLAMLAHELRNPLAPIRSALGIMALTPGLSPQIAWVRDVIERQTTHLTRLVDDLLDVSRVTRGKLRMQGLPMDLGVALHRAIESSQPLIEQRRHRLHLALSPQPLTVNGDLTRLTQVFLNLLNNAAKYTPEGGDIWLESVQQGSDVVVRVRDSGVGISPALLENVFDMFAQGERSIARSEGGLGIGLTLARRIVALHGGSVVARSEGAGLGAEFVVCLPQLNLELPESRVPGYGQELPAVIHKRSILVVDDNLDAASSTATLLRMVGHDVAVAHDGPEALERINASAPDILLLDIGLPGMDGYEVATRLRSRPEGQRLRIYAMTGYGQNADRERTLGLGFDGHLLKPVVPADLISLIEEASTAAPRSEGEPPVGDGDIQ